jgi:hypothetical protein
MQTGRFVWQHIVRYALRHRFLALINVLSGCGRLSGDPDHQL